MYRAVFLDRDNTIIHNDGDLGDPDQVRLMQGAAMAIASLCGLGYRIVVVTNQGGVARGKYGEDDVMRVHERLADVVARTATGAHIDRFYYCPYHPAGSVQEYCTEHPWRKPQPGMFLQAAEDLQIDLGQSWMIGDQMRDVQAGAAAGCKTILLRTDAGRPETPDGGPEAAAEPALRASGGTETVKPDYTVRTLIEAVRIIAQRKPDSAEDARTAAHVVGKRWNAAAVKELQRSLKRSPAGEGPAEARQTNEPDDSDPLAEERRAARGGQTSRPFRPWGAPSGEEEQAEFGAIRERVRQRRADERTEPERRSEPQEAAPAPPVLPPAPEAPEPVRPVAEEDAEEGGRTTEATLSVSPVDEPARQPEPSPPQGMAQTLRLILQELRHQRGTGDDYSYLTVIAIVLQTIAGVCLLGGLWMGAGDDSLFARWMGAGLLIQLATIAVLLFGRR